MNCAEYNTHTTYPNGEVVKQTFNTQGLLSEVKSDTGSYNQIYANTFVYDEAGRRTSMTLGSGLVNTHTYYGWGSYGGRLQRIQTGSLQNLTYTYDPLGNVLTMADGTTGQPTSGQTQTFTYDHLAH